MKNLKVSSKLVFGFSIITLILIVSGMREFRVLNRFNKVNQDVQKSNSLSDNIMEAKYYMRSDMQILMEMIASTGTEQLNNNI